MRIGQKLKDALIVPSVGLAQQRRLTGGKNLDGSFWIEIEGQGRVMLSPQQMFGICTGFLRAMGIELQIQAPPGGQGGH